MEKSLWRRHMHKGNTQVRNAARAATKALARNIATVEAPTTAELLACHVKRMDMKQHEI